MAHLLDRSAGFDAIAFRGDTPWHGLGQSMRGDETLDQWRIRAGLGWEALKAPVLFRKAPPVAALAGFATLDGEGNPVPEAPLARAAGQSVIYRGDTGAALGIVGDDYRIVQPRDVMEFYRDLTERHGFEMETAGAIKDGRVIWALARTGDDMRISGTDRVGGYLLLSTSFDGSAATTGRFTTVRVVCNNTLSAATAGGRPAVSVTHRAMFDADAAKVKLGVGDAFVKFQDDAQRMAEAGVSPEQTVAFFLNVYHRLTTPEEIAKAPEAVTKAADKTIARLVSLYLNGPGADLRSAKGTAWGLLNAVTRDVDHSTRARSPDSRLSSAWFGPGEAIKNRAREAALAIAA